MNISELESLNPLPPLLCSSPEEYKLFLIVHYFMKRRLHRLTLKNEIWEPHSFQFSTKNFAIEVDALADGHKYVTISTPNRGYEIEFTIFENKMDALCSNCVTPDDQSVIKLINDVYEYVLSSRYASHISNVCI